MNRLKDMVKNIIFILLIILVFKTLVSYQLAKTQYQTYEYSVKYSDTIWNIAAKICSENEDLYIRKVVADIKEINSLDSSTIYIGQTIKLPIYN